MRFARLACIALSATTPLDAREMIGTYGMWAAVCDEHRSCSAMAQPDGSDRRGWLAVQPASGALVIDAGRPIDRATILIAGRRFALSTSGSRARASSSATRQIVAAIRRADLLTIEARASTGRRFHQRYALRGAPSAIDAAALAALR
jgi:hypothetical protein